MREGTYLVFRKMAAMSERDKRALKRQQTQLEDERKELMGKLETQRRLIESLQESKKKEESKSDGIDRDSSRAQGQASGGEQPDNTEKTRTPKRVDRSTDVRKMADKKELTEASQTQLEVIDEVGESPDRRLVHSTIPKEVSRMDDDFDVRYKRLKQKLTDSLNITHDVTGAQKETTEKSRASKSLPTIIQAEDNPDRLSLTKYLVRNRWTKLISEEEDTSERGENKTSDQLSTGSFDDTRDGAYFDTGQDMEERQIVDRVKKLEYQERIVDEQIRRKGAEEEQRIQRLKELRMHQYFENEQRRRSETLMVLKEKEREAEKRLEAKVRMQIDFDNRLRQLQREEEVLSSRTRQFKVEPEAQSTPRIRVDIPPGRNEADALRENELDRREEYLRQIEAGLQQEQQRQSEIAHMKDQQSSLKNAQMLEQQAIREQELNGQEQYLQQKESELQQKEEKLQEAMKAHERILPLQSELEEKTAKEHELDRKETYLRQLERELSKKEEDIRKQLKLRTEKPVIEQGIDQSRHSGISKKDTDNSESKQRDPSKTEVREKVISPFVKPYVNFFSGTEPVPKNESNFEQWKVEIDSLRDSSGYPEHIVNQVMRNSLKGEARRVLFTLGPEATADDIMQKLQVTFGNVASGQTVLQEFYTAEQKENESVTLWGIRLEEIYQRAIDKVLQQMSREIRCLLNASGDHFGA